MTMATYAQLANEPEWGAQYTPPAMVTELLAPLRELYGLGPNAVGAAGDNNHLSGRHRSYAWCRNSRFCGDRGYGTSDARDQGGDRNWYRAADVGITGQALFDASRRMDALVRSGRAPGIAEWFGTFDGVRVVGWFQGNPSTSDSSHLFHLHVGFWNSSANDQVLMRLVYATIAGIEDPSTVPAADMRRDAMFRMIDPEGNQFVIAPDALSPTGWSYVEITPDRQGWALVAAGIGTANGNVNDPNADPHSKGGGALDWRPGMFGPSKAEVRAQFLADVLAGVRAAPE
jgi:hypothetical protein